MTPSKQILILIGPPGAGKGTQAELLSDKLKLYQFDTSKLLEENFKKAEALSEDSPERFIEVEGERFDILNEKKIWLTGKLCTPAFVTHLIKEKVKDLAAQDYSIIFSGSPRTVYEASKEAPLFKELYGKENIKTFYIRISPEQTAFRNTHRRICELIRHSILYNKETETLTVCPLDGSKLVRREGLDDPETIKVRLKEFAERTFPVLDILKKEGIKITEINGEQTVAQVFADICKKL